MQQGCPTCGCQGHGVQQSAGPESVRDRLERRLRVAENGCWEWTGAMSQAGYGFIKVGGKQLRVHRVSYELHVGPIPEGLHIDHLCRNRACANPEHLEPVTPEENTRRAVQDVRRARPADVCAHGHSLAGRNVYVNTKGWQECRACRADQRGRYHARLRQERRTSNQ